MKLTRYLAIVLAAAPLWAGVRIQVEMTDLKSKEVTKQEMLIDSDRLRMNMQGSNSNMSVMFLTDGGRNRMVMLDKNRNEYREMDQETMDQIGAQMSGAMAQLNEQMKNMPPEQRAMMERMMKGRMGQMGQASEPVKTVYTAKGSATVNGFACTQYEGMRGADKVSELCAAKPAALSMSASDFQVFDKMREFMSGLMKAMANSPFAGSMNMRQITDTGFEGFPVEQTSFSNGQATTKTEVKSVQQASFSDADFSTGNAKKMEFMPGRGR